MDLITEIPKNYFAVIYVPPLTKSFSRIGFYILCKVASMINKIFIYTLFLLSMSSFGLDTATSNTQHQSTPKIQSFLNKFCIDCHDGDLQKGNVRLDDFSGLNNLAKDVMLNKIEEQVYLGLMPPKKKKQPGEGERARLFENINVGFEAIGLSSKFKEKLKLPAYGNYIDHDKLFSGEFKNLKGD